ncbi:MAG: response regulator [Desulfotomaculales bacterium]|jgi:two-component system response regulator DctR
MDFIDVVVIEDDPMVLEINCSFVNAVPGFRVVGVAKTGQEALTLIKKEIPSLALLDVYLPDEGGVKILQEIRKQGLPTDVILVTAAHDSETIQNSFRYGAVDYIIKPFKFSRLQNALENYARLKKRLRSKTYLRQEELDGLTLNRGAIRQKEQGELPKGLNELTLRQITLYLFKQEQPLSAEEVARELGLARVTVRRYLEYLFAEGRAELELQYGTVGRPVKKYKVL